MNLEIYLNNGVKFTASNVTGFTGKDFTSDLNNQQIQYINIGDLILNRNAIMMIVPAEVTPTEE